MESPADVGKSRWLKRMVVSFGVLGVLLLIVGKAVAGLVEYALILALIAILVIVALKLKNGQAFVTVGHLLQSDIEEAQLANSQGDTIHEVAALSSAIGAGNALLGITTSCSTCGTVRDDLKRIIHLAEISRLEAEGIPTTCTPDGIVEPTEECDPLLVPDGCSAGTFVGFCDSQCLCEAITP